MCVGWEVEHRCVGVILENRKLKGEGEGLVLGTLFLLVGEALEGRAK